VATTALLAVAALIAGCRKKPAPPIPTEKALIVKVTRAPALAELQPAAAPVRAVSWGEVYRAVERKADFRWSGSFDGLATQRDGAVGVRRSDDDATRFAFAADLLEGDVPTIAWLCAAFPAERAPDRCAERLLRLVVDDGVLFAFVPGHRADVSLLEVIDGASHVTTVAGLADARIVSLSGRPVVLVTSRWARGPGWTGTDVIAFLPRPALHRAGELHLEEIDGRDAARATYWFGALEASDVLRVKGRRSVRDRSSDAELSGADVDETWALDGDRLVKR
jgi:hypothetical protein